MTTNLIENGITKWKSISSYQIRNAPKEKEKDLAATENNLNAQTQVIRYLKRVLRNQVYSYNQDELLKDDGWLNTIQVWRWVTSFLLIFSPKFLLVDVFMLVSCLECHGIQCFELCGINEKKKSLARNLFATQLHYLLFIYSIATHFSPRKAGRRWRLMKKKKVWQLMQLSWQRFGN